MFIAPQLALSAQHIGHVWMLPPTAQTPGSVPRRLISIAWGYDRLPGRQAQTRAASKHALTVVSDGTVLRKTRTVAWRRVHCSQRASVYGAVPSRRSDSPAFPASPGKAKLTGYGLRSCRRRERIYTVLIKRFYSSMLFD